MNSPALPGTGVRRTIEAIVDAGFVDHPAIFPRTAIADGGLIGVQFDDGIVHAAPGHGGQDVLDGVHFRGALAQDRAPPPLGILDRVLRADPDARRAGQIGAGGRDRPRLA